MSFGSRIAALASSITTRIAGGAVASGELVDSVTPETALYNQFARIGGNMSPAIVSNIVAEADAGTPGRLVDLTHECRQKDGHLQAVLALRELSVLGLDWSIELPEGASRRDKKAARLLTMALEQCDTLPLLIAHELGESTLFGYSFAEAIWRFEERGELRGLLVPDSYEPVHCNRFGFRQSDGELMFLPQAGAVADTGGVDLLGEYPLGKYVASIRRVNGDTLVREGLSRMLVWFALFRNWNIRDWLQFGEIGWKPWRLGFYDKGAHKNDVSALKRAMRFLTTAGSGVFPKTTDVRIERGSTSVAGIASTHKELYDALGAEISKGVVGQTLTMESGTRGARSLGEVHNEVRHDIRDADAQIVERFMTRYVCKPFVLYNYGPGVAVGRFRLNVAEGVDLEKLANAIDKLAGKIDIPQEWVREQGGIREPRPDEPLVMDGHQEPEPPGDGEGGNDGEEGGTGEQAEEAA